MDANNMERVEMKPTRMDPEQRQKEADFLKQASGDDLKQLFNQVAPVPGLVD